MTLKSIFYAGLIATTGLVVSQASVQAASLTHMKSVLPFSQAHSHTEALQGLNSIQIGRAHV